MRWAIHLSFKIYNFIPPTLYRIFGMLRFFLSLIFSQFSPDSYREFRHASKAQALSNDHRTFALRPDMSLFILSRF